MDNRRRNLWIRLALLATVLGLFLLKWTSSQRGDTAESDRPAAGRDPSQRVIRASTVLRARTAPRNLSSTFELRETRQIAGVVIGSDGLPARGATVELHEFSLTGRTTPTTIADAAGHFDLGPQPAERVFFRYIISARSGEESGAETIDVLARSSDHIVIRLESCPEWITIKVRDVDRDPLTTATVRTQRAWGVELATHPVDGSGQVELCRRPSDQLIVMADGFAAAAVKGPQPAGGFEVVLFPGGRVVGEVVDEEGLPVGGATVSLIRNIQNLQAGSARAPFVRVTLSAAAGTFEFSGVPSGSYELSADARDLLIPEPPWPGISVAPDGVPQNALLVMRRCRLIAGRVMAAGKPMGGALVEGQETASDGTFVLDCMPRTELELDVDGLEVVAAQIPAGERDIDDLIVEVRGAVGAVVGHVTRDGVPVAGVWVSGEKDSASEGFQTRTDSDGRYRLPPCQRE
jgi:hypothetical protein